MLIRPNHHHHPPATVLLAGTTIFAVVSVVVVCWRRYQNEQQDDDDCSPSTTAIATVECRCGKVCLRIDNHVALTKSKSKPVVGTAPVTHLVCYCNHCQHYLQCLRAHHSNRPVCDAQGGSRICHLYRRHVRLLPQPAERQPRTTTADNSNTAPAATATTTTPSSSSSSLLQWTTFHPDPVPLRSQPMFRAHTTCCKTPLISAYWNDLPVVGIYTANLRIRTAVSSSSSDKNNNPPTTDVFVKPNPVTRLWDDDDDNSSPVGPPEYRIHCQHALPPLSSPTSSSSLSSSSKKTTTTTKASDLLLPLSLLQRTLHDDASASRPPRGHNGFPLSLLVRHLWRNHVVGPKLRPTDFSMPPDAKPILLG